MTAIVDLGSSVSHPGDVVVINTQSRHLSLKRPCQKNINAIQSLRNPEKSLPSVWIYKKINSAFFEATPGVGLHAIVGALNYTHALVAPCFPRPGAHLGQRQTISRWSAARKHPFQEPAALLRPPDTFCSSFTSTSNKMHRSLVGAARCQHRWQVSSRAFSNHLHRRC